MDEAVLGLVISPFKELVEKGNTALNNANDGSSPDMQKTAKALLKEGERALKKIEPLCEKLFEEYGSVFVAALKENDEIAQYRTDLNDLLWEFDDYVEVDDFDADKFAELQALSRKAAPRILEILNRLKLEVPKIEPPSPLSNTSREFQGILDFPNGQSSRTQSRNDDSRRSGSSYYGEGESSRVSYIMGAQAGPDLGLDIKPLFVSRSEGKRPEEMRPEEKRLDPPPDSNADYLRPESPKQPLPARKVESPVEEVPAEVPPEPPLNPWQLNKHHPAAAKVDQSPVTTRPERRRLPSEGGDIGSLSPPAAQPDTEKAPRRLDIGVDRMLQEEKEQRRRATVDDRLGGVPAANGHARQPSVASTSAASVTASVTGSPNLSRTPSATLPSQRNKVDSTSQVMVEALQAGAVGESPILPQRWSQASSAAGSYQHSIFEARGRDSLVSPATTDNRISFPSNVEHSPASVTREHFPAVPEEETPVTMTPNFASNPFPNPPPYSQGPARPDMFLQRAAPVPVPAPIAAPMLADQPGLEPMIRTPQRPIVAMDDGLIPVEPDKPLPTVPELPNRPQDCTITLNSSFYQLKGFCEGAKEVVRGGIGVKKTKKQGFSGTMVVAKCKHCLYELEWKQVEADLNSAETGNYKSSGVGFRLRFLSKSHLPARSIEDQLYGCLFCIQRGQTMEESDATVFFTQKQLFAHLARHPRPFPAVPGLTVIEGGPELPPHFRNNYDLHFINPPNRSVMAGIGREICSMPYVTATETFRATHGTLRGPPDQSAVLQFAVGAKIVGVEFPERFGGEWGMGWADNTRAVFPVDHVRLNPPPASDIRMQGTSNMKAVARWKFHVKDSQKAAEHKDWLSFNKGDTITNISWPYAEHWCWAGTNSKGKWGIFPQSHIEPNSLREMPVISDRASTFSHERKSSTHLFSKMSIRHSSSRSSEGSATPTSPKPLIY